MAPQSSSSDQLTQPRVGQVLGERYRIDALIDEGAMGRVYRGEHVHMRKRVAIKILRRELTQVPEVLARFEREAMAAANINHQHVAAATDFGKLADGSVYLVLEFVEGRTLRSELATGPLSVYRALHICQQMADALAAAHELDIVHRDLKPENVMLVERGDNRDYVKVLDFGVAKVPIDMAESEQSRSETGSLITKAGMIFGTPDYMAPEQALGQPVDYRADLYSLGVVLFELLTGRRPFRSDHELGVLGQQLSKGVPPMSQRAPGIQVPAEVEAYVRALMVNESSERVQTAKEASAKLAALMSRVPDTLPPSAPVERDGPQSEEAPLSAPVSEAAEELKKAAKAAPAVAAAAAKVAAEYSRDRAKRIAAATGPSLRGLGARARSLPHTLERLKERLPEPISLMPVWVLLTVPTVFLVGVVALITALASGTDEVKPSMPPLAETISADGEPPPQASAAQVADAFEQGEDAIKALAEQFPEDGNVQVALARTAVQGEDYQTALQAIERALELAPSLKDNEYVAGVLWKTAQQPNTERDTFELLKGPMKSRGADIIYDLASTPKVHPSRAKRARAWLKTKGFERACTKEASVAAALLLASSCEVRKALVKRAENVGDKRSRLLLEQFQAGQGCLPTEDQPCNACLQSDPGVQLAIAKIKARQASSSGK